MPLRAPASRQEDVVATFNIVATPTTVVWQTANLGLYLRSTGNGTITKLGIHVVASSGNISLAVYQGSGVGRARVPGACLATTGAVACPAAGYQEVSLGASVNVTSADFLSMSCDNTTASFLGISGNVSGLALGLSFTQATAHPLTASAGTLAASMFRIPQIVGVA